MKSIVDTIRESLDNCSRDTVLIHLGWALGEIEHLEKLLEEQSGEVGVHRIDDTRFLI